LQLARIMECGLKCYSSLCIFSTSLTMHRADRPTISSVVVIGTLALLSGLVHFGTARRGDKVLL